MNQDVSATRPPTKMEQAIGVLESTPFWPVILAVTNAASLGTVGTILSKHYSNYQIKQILALLKDLNRRIENSLPEPGSDTFYTALQICLKDTLETQSKRKIELFASILAGTWRNSSSRWDEVSQTLKLVRGLEDVHIEILMHALDVYTSAGESATFSIGTKGYQSSTRLDQALKHIDPMLLTSCVSDLISSGLLNDSFIAKTPARFSSNTTKSTPTPAPMAYSISNLGIWLLKKINDPEISNKSKDQN